MRFLFATSIKYPSPLGSRHQAANMARAFQKALGSDFYFGARNLPDGSEGVQLIRISGKKVSALFAWRYLRVIKAYGITHVYCREARMLFFLELLLRLFGRRSGVHLSFEEHACVSRRWWYTYLLRHVDTVVVLTSTLKKHVSEIGAKRMHVIPHGVSVDIFSVSLSKNKAREQLSLPQEAYILGFTGTMTTMNGVEKGIGAVLEALAQLPDDAVFYTVGGSSEDSVRYRKVAESLGVLNCISFRGPVPQKALAQFQRACDVLLLPLPANEYAAMLPLKVFEYMASGQPIVASDLPSVREVLNEENAFLTRPGDASALARTIMYVREHPEEATKRAKQAQADVQAYTWEKRVKRILDVIS